MKYITLKFLVHEIYSEVSIQMLLGMEGFSSFKMLLIQMRVLDGGKCLSSLYKAFHKESVV